jgi:cytochrome b561
MIRRRSALLHMAGGMPVLRLMAVVLAGVMILHVLAALFHQFVLKDGLVRRMLFGQRGSKSSVPAR